MPWQSGTNNAAMAADLTLVKVYHTVPAADAVTNALIRDVLGNKNDAAGSTSLIGQTKAVLTLLYRATNDTTDNLYERDVLGSKADAAVYAVGVNKSLVAYSKGIIGLLGDFSAHTLATLALKLGDKATTVAAVADVQNASDGGNLTHTVTVAHDVNETQIAEVQKTGIYQLSAFFDLNALDAAAEGTIATIRVYNKIDGAAYSTLPLGSMVYTVGAMTEIPTIEVMMVHGYCKVTIQLQTAVTDNRAIPYRLITKDLGA